MRYCSSKNTTGRPLYIYIDIFCNDLKEDLHRIEFYTEFLRKTTGRSLSSRILSKILRNATTRASYSRILCKVLKEACWKAIIKWNLT
jgi:hypothetical protein